ncbi:MAG: Flagellar hook-associated protein 1 [Ignavibacteria bacterium]|nr:Flagellar hook-associated protein 1 [Ignavibacteria bacterium]
MGNFNSLEIGKRGLLASQFGLDVTSNNIANVNTPGYSRRMTSLIQSDPLHTNNGFMGTGVMADKLRSFREDFFDNEIRSTLSRKSGYDADQEILHKIETSLAEPSDLDVAKLVNQFFNAFNEASTQPENIGMREHLLGVTQTLVDRFHNLSQKFSDIRRDTNNSLNNSTKQANTLIKQIAGLNKSIAQSYTEGSVPGQTMVDEREKLLEELSKLMNTTIGTGENGSVNVYINGINIITGPVYSELGLQEKIDTETGERTLEIIKTDSKSMKTVLNPQAGEITSNLKHYNITLDENDLSGEYSPIQKLNDLANAIVQKVNAISLNGFGLDDTSTNSPARAIFEPSVGKASAANIAVSKDIKGKPRNIPFSDSPKEGGNNKIALQIARLASDPVFIDGGTPSEFYAAFIGKIGTMSQEAQSATSTTRMVADQLESQRQSTIGVNLDEEAINIVKFQKAFEASSRVISITNDILGTIINLGR